MNNFPNPYLTPYKMGKKPARKDAVLFKFLDYFSKRELPKPPKVFGPWRHFDDIEMYDNNTVGNCVFAGAANETEAFFYSTGRYVEFTTENVISDYTALTGYNPVIDYDPGSDMSDAAKYRRTIGIVDDKGKRHKIDAYVRLGTGKFEDLKIAMYLFGVVGIGLLMPEYAQPDFHKKKPWDTRKRESDMSGGHYVSGCGIDEKGNIVFMTWGRYHTMTKKFYEKYNDESTGYFSVERLVNSVSPEGFKAERLIADLKSLKKPFGYSGYTLAFDRIKGKKKLDKKKIIV
jgi:hypothetical protein